MAVMTEQKRKFTLGEVNTRMGTMGEVRFDPSLLDVLGIKPGDFIVFTISTEGVVTVAGEKKAAITKPATTSPGLAGMTSTDVTQPALFDPGQPTPRPPQLRRIR
jgi:hypothetical protein